MSLGQPYLGTQGLAEHSPPAALSKGCVPIALFQPAFTSDGVVVQLCTVRLSSHQGQGGPETGPLSCTGPAGGRGGRRPSCPLASLALRRVPAWGAGHLQPCSSGPSPPLRRGFCNGSRLQTLPEACPSLCVERVSPCLSSRHQPTGHLGHMGCPGSPAWGWPQGALSSEDFPPHSPRSGSAG